MIDSIFKTQCSEQAYSWQRRLGGLVPRKSRFIKALVIRSRVIKAQVIKLLVIKLRARRLILGVLMSASVITLASAFWIEAKAEVAQWLVAQSWAEQLAATNKNKIKPWPWADMTVAGKLTVDELGIERFVFDNDRPRTLAFGAGLATGSGAAARGPAASRSASAVKAARVVSAHRDTHFKFLQHVELGMTVEFEDAYGQVSSYEVTETAVVDSRTEALPVATDSGALVLVTCFPFDAIAAGGPLRFVVTAKPRRPETLLVRAMPVGFSDDHWFADKEVIQL